MKAPARRSAAAASRPPTYVLTTVSGLAAERKEDPGGPVVSGMTEDMIRRSSLEELEERLTALKATGLQIVEQIDLDRAHRRADSERRTAQVTEISERATSTRSPARIPSKLSPPLRPAQPTLTSKQTPHPGPPRGPPGRQLTRRASSMRQLYNTSKNLSCLDK
jgi:hypothetical protein